MAVRLLIGQLGSHTSGKCHECLDTTRTGRLPPPVPGWQRAVLLWLANRCSTRRPCTTLGNPRRQILASRPSRCAPSGAQGQAPAARRVPIRLLRGYPKGREVSLPRPGSRRPRAACQGPIYRWVGQPRATPRCPAAGSRHSRCRTAARATGPGHPADGPHVTATTCCSCMCRTT